MELALVVILGVCFLCLMIRAILGPTVFDRILVMNGFGTYIVVFIVAIGEVFKTPYFIDVAIIYALINFVTTVALLRYFKFKGQGNK